MYFTDLDTQRYYYGYNSKEAVDSINRHDHRLSEILNINVEFKNQGLINVDNNEKILNYDAYLKSCDGSAYIFKR